MKIAIIGCRGIPAAYGGFETFAQGLVENLDKKDFEITVSCEYRPPDEREDSYKGSKLKYFPLKPPENYFLRKFYENLSDIYFLIKLSRNHELIYFLGIEVGMFIFLPKLFNRKIKVIVNVDGVMWERSKFNRFERWLLKKNHDIATVFADEIIVDSLAMKDYVDDNKLHKTNYLSYGINIPNRITWNESDLKLLKHYTSNEINPGNYFLLVARLEPENNIHTIITAYCKANIDIPLVVVGDYTSEAYRMEIETLALDSINPGVIFLGSIYDQNLLNMLRQNCMAYIHGHSVGGTNPSLLEAAISKNIIIAHDNQFNQEVCGEAAIYFENERTLERKLKSIARHHRSYSELKNKVYHKVRKDYSWNHITTGYLALFTKIKQEDNKLIRHSGVNHEQKKA